MMDIKNVRLSRKLIPDWETEMFRYSVPLRGPSNTIQTPDQQLHAS